MSGVLRYGMIRDDKLSCVKFFISIFFWASAFVFLNGNNGKELYRHAFHSAPLLTWCRLASFPCESGLAVAWKAR